MSRNGRNAKSPAFQLYATDFLSDPKVLAMTTEEVGAYILLLCAEWIDGPLPLEHHYLARIARMTPERFNEAWKSISRCFEVRDKTISNPRLERERQFQVESRARFAALSKKGVEARSAAQEGGTVTARSPYGNLPTPDTRHPIPDTRLPRERESPPPEAPIPIPVDHAEPVQASRLIARLALHPKLDVPGVRTALARWEAHRSERGVAGYTASAAEACMLAWEQHGPDWLVRAVAVWISKNAKQWFELDEPAAPPPEAKSDIAEKAREIMSWGKKRKGAK